jgi:acetyl esterase/lipase
MKILRGLFLMLGGLLALFGCSKAALLNFTIPRDDYTVVHDIAYGRDARQKLDIYLPVQPTAGHPVIVFFYGGSWQTGSKADYLFVGQAFASRGYITVIADYRLYPQAPYPAFMDDCAAAFVWTHAHIADYGGDPDNLFVGGHSAGGYNAVMLTANETYIKQAGGQPAWIKATFGLSGPYDFLPLTDPALIELFGGAHNAASQPITYAKPGLPPMLLLYGDKDTEVLPRNSINMAARLRANGDTVADKAYPGFDHIDIVLALASGFRGKGPVLDDVDSFLRAHIH